MVIGCFQILCLKKENTLVGAGAQNLISAIRKLKSDIRCQNSMITLIKIFMKISELTEFDEESNARLPAMIKSNMRQN
jgi:hypothetical protein